MIKTTRKRGFTLAEMMIVIVIVSLVLVGGVPIVTTKKTVVSKTPWNWAKNGSDIFAATGDTQTAIIGQTTSVTTPNTKLLINTIENELPLLYYKKNAGSSTRTILGSMFLGIDNIFLGDKVASNPNTFGNVILGYNNAIINGSENVAIGYYAFRKNTNQTDSEGGYNNNVAIGYNSMNYSKCNNCVSMQDKPDVNGFNGSYNTAIGHNNITEQVPTYGTITGYGQIQGYYNTSITPYPSTSMSYGSNYNSYNNVTIGNNAGRNNSGYANTFLGQYSAYTSNTNENSYNNTFIGGYTGYNSNTYNSNSVAIGNYALSNYGALQSGYFNIAIGENANKIDELVNNTELNTNHHNVSIGFNAGSIGRASSLEKLEDDCNYNRDQEHCHWKQNVNHNINIGAYAGNPRIKTNTGLDQSSIHIGYNSYSFYKQNESPYAHITIGYKARSFFHHGTSIGVNTGRLNLYQGENQDSGEQVIITAIGYNACDGVRAKNGRSATRIGYYSSRPKNKDDFPSQDRDLVYVGNTNLYVPHYDEKSDNTIYYNKEFIDGIYAPRSSTYRGDNALSDGNPYDPYEHQYLGSNVHASVVPEFNYIYIPGNLVVVGNTSFIEDNCVYKNGNDNGNCATSDKYNGSRAELSTTDQGLQTKNDTMVISHLSVPVSIIQYYNKDLNTNDLGSNIRCQGSHANNINNLYSTTSGKLKESATCFEGVHYNDKEKIFYYNSDIRLKNITSENTDGLAKIKKLKVYNYTFKKDKSKTPHVGVIAQDVLKIFPNAIFKDENGYLMVRKEDIFYALINAVKELDLKVKFAISQLKDMFAKVAQIDLKLKNLEQSNEKINTQIADIDKRIEALEK